MSVLVERILNHPDLTIDLFQARKGEFFFVGTSEKYEPKTAVSDTAWKCFLKFDIPLWEQKAIAEQMRNQQD